jgi:hypothetical protein
MAGTDQQQVCCHCNATGVLDPSCLAAHLVLAQPQVGLQFAVDLLHRPPALIRTHHLPRRPLVQIDHQDFRLLRAQVTPSFAQNHHDVTEEL